MPVPRTYEEKVREGLSLSKKSEESNWALARLTHEVITEGQATAKQWAEDIALSVTTVNRYLKVWDRYSDPATRNASWSFNNHVEAALLSDERAKTILARAEKDGVSIDIARKRINTEDRFRENPTPAITPEVEPRAEDEKAAFEDTGVALEAHRKAVEDARKTVIEDRGRQGAQEATKPFIASAVATRVFMIPG